MKQEAPHTTKRRGTKSEVGCIKKDDMKVMALSVFRIPYKGIFFRATLYVQAIWMILNYSNSLIF